MKIWEPKPPGTLWATPGLLRDSFTFTFTLKDEELQSHTALQIVLYFLYNITLSPLLSASNYDVL